MLTVGQLNPALNSPGLPTDYRCLTKLRHIRIQNLGLLYFVSITGESHMYFVGEEAIADTDITQVWNAGFFWL